jgi:predicted ferric reductase
MRFTYKKAFYWLGLFLILSLVPFGLALIGPIPAPRSYWVEFGVGLGFVGMGIMALQFITSGRFHSVAPSFGSDYVLQFHRQAGIVGFLLVLAHPAVMILSNPAYLEYFDPRVNLLRALALSFVTVTLIAIIVTSIWREPVGLQYEWWRLLHGLLALAIIFIGMVHAVQVGHYLNALWKQGIWTGGLLGIMYLVVHTRLVRPWLMSRRPYKVVEMKEERSNTWSMTLAPDGHEGMRFQAGQFAWITVGDSPFSLQQNPFSFSSSAHQEHLTFTAQVVGDFTSTWANIEPGTRAFLEGPFGGFIRYPLAKGLFFIIGGSGIGPAMSIIRTMYDDKDQRPVILLYGNPRWEEVVFRDELAELSQEMNLQVVHILEEPPPNWTGEKGLLDREMLARYLPDNIEQFEFFSCGPKPLMDLAESELRAMGVSWQRIISERFKIV